MPDAIEATTPSAPPKGTPAREVPPAATLNDGPAVDTGAADRAAIMAALAASRKAATDDALPEAEEPEETAEPAAEPVAASLAADVQARAEEPPAAESVEEAPEAPVEAVADEKSKRLRRLLASKAELGAAKDEAAQAREAARQIVAQAQQEAQAAATRIVQEAQAQAAATVRQALDELRTRPAAAAARLGLDPAQLLAQQAEEADPLAVMGRKFEGELTARDKKLEEALKVVETLKRQDQERTQYLAHVQRTQAETNFLKTASATTKTNGADGVETDVDTYPFAAAVWGKDELLRRANEVISKGAEAAKKAGEAFDIDDGELLSYLNEEAQREFTARLSPKVTKLLQLVGAEADKAKANAKANGKTAAGTAKTDAKAPAGSGQKPRTVAASTSGERRSPPSTQPVEELSDNEFRKRAQRVIRENRRQSD